MRLPPMTGAPRGPYARHALCCLSATGSNKKTTWAKEPVRRTRYATIRPRLALFFVEVHGEDLLDAWSYEW